MPQNVASRQLSSFNTGQVMTIRPADWQRCSSASRGPSCFWTIQKLEFSSMVTAIDKV